MSLPRSCWASLLLCGQGAQVCPETSEPPWGHGTCQCHPSGHEESKAQGYWIQRQALLGASLGPDMCIHWRHKL